MSIVSTRYGDMRIIDNDKVISHSLLIYGEWAMDEINLLKQIITPGAYVLDVGAFIGTHTLAFSNMVGEQGKVYSFEPRREIYTILSENISTNCKNVIAQNIGLAEELKTLHLDRIDTKSNENFGGLSLSEDLESSSNTYQVEISTIDVLDFKKIDLIKIDVEGMERKVLDGAVKSIRRHKPVIYCECNSLNAGNEIIEFCSEQKYKVWGFLASAYNPNLAGV